MISFDWLVDALIV